MLNKKLNIFSFWQKINNILLGINNSSSKPNITDG